MYSYSKITCLSPSLLLLRLLLNKFSNVFFWLSNYIYTSYYYYDNMRCHRTLVLCDKHDRIFCCSSWISSSSVSSYSNNMYYIDNSYQKPISATN